MKELKVGGIVEIKDNQKLQIIDITSLRNKKYLLCVNIKKRTEPIIIEYKYENDELLYRIEKDKKTLLELYSSIYKNSLKPYGT